MQPVYRLFTFSLSHFSEKARWALSASGVPFQEEPWTPFFHAVPALRSGGRTTVPILEAGSRRVQDSTKILHFLNEHWGRLPVLPEGDEQCAAAWEVEDRFDRVGRHVVPFVYDRALADAESVIRYWTLDATPGQAGFIRNTYPALRFVFQRKLRLGARTVARARDVITEGLDWIEARASDARPHLVGDCLSIADITAASLLAPLACPDEHPVYGTDRYRRGVAPIVAALGQRPAFDWVRAVYRHHRAPSPRAAEIRRALDG